MTSRCSPGSPARAARTALASSASSAFSAGTLALPPRECRLRDVLSQVRAPQRPQGRGIHQVTGTIEYRLKCPLVPVLEPSHELHVTELAVVWITRRYVHAGEARFQFVQELMVRHHS